QKVYKCQIEVIEPNRIGINLIEAVDINTELPQHITLCSGLIKADKYEWMIQKSTELGASQFIAVGMQRSVVKLNDSKITKKLEHWQKIIKEAAEQSYRLIITEIEYKSNLKEIYDIIDEYDDVLIAYEESAKCGEEMTFKAVDKKIEHRDRRLTLVGKEGD